MSNHASVDTSTLAEVNDSGGDSFSRLEAYFTTQGSQVENSDAEADEAIAPEAEVVPDEPEAETEPEKAADEAESNAEAAPEPEAEAEAETADFDALERKDGEYLDADGLKAKFPRNSSKELIAEAARYSEAAKKGSEVITSLGGEEFVPGASAIVKSLRDGDYRGTLAGIAETVGPEGLVYSVAEAMRMGFVEADKMAASDNPIQQHFGKTMMAVVDSVIEQRFGEDITISELSKLAEWKRAGWFEKIEKWAEESYVDHDELDELLEVTNDPKLIAKRQELKRLESQLAETKTKANESTAAKQAEIENQFDTAQGDKIEEIYLNVVLAKSPLRDMPNDTPEVKAAKAVQRKYLVQDAQALFRSDPSRAKLLEGYMTGQSKTAVYQSRQAEAINKAILGTRASVAAIEGMLAGLYGGTRNAQLAKKQNRTQEIQPATTGQRTPTQTTDFGGEKPSSDELRDRLAQRIAAIG